MLHKFFQWRAQRRLSRTRYRLDRRTYRHSFGPGFFCTAYGINFLESSDDARGRGRGRSRRFRRFLGGLVLTGCMAGLGWVAVESVAFFSLF